MRCSAKARGRPCVAAGRRRAAAAPRAPARCFRSGRADDAGALGHPGCGGRQAGLRAAAAPARSSKRRRGAARRSSLSIRRTGRSALPWAEASADENAVRRALDIPPCPLEPMLATLIARPVAPLARQANRLGLPEFFVSRSALTLASARASSSMAATSMSRARIGRASAPVVAASSDNRAATRIYAQALRAAEDVAVRNAWRYRLLFLFSSMATVIASALVAGATRFRERAPPRSGVVRFRRRRAGRRPRPLRHTPALAPSVVRIAGVAERLRVVSRVAAWRVAGQLRRGRSLARLVRGRWRANCRCSPANLPTSSAKCATF